MKTELTDLTETTIDIIINGIEAANPQRSFANLPRRFHKFLEEIGELAEAYLNSTSQNNGKGKAWADVLEEAVDAMIVAIDISLSIPKAKENIIRHLKGHPIACMWPVDYDVETYDLIVSDLMGDFSAFWYRCRTKSIDDLESDAVVFSKNAVELVQYLYSLYPSSDGLRMNTSLNEIGIINEVERKLLKWATSRNKVAQINPEG